MSPRKASDLTVTDQFCGAGGSSIGAKRRGLRIRMALNHWKRAIDTHQANFPETDHDCTDISACDPRRYPSTDVLITSPECTTHSPAGGRRKPQQQRDLFRPTSPDAATERSRATMYDVCRFAEYHRYELIICENVVEAYSGWALFHDWLGMMSTLGYNHRIVSLNSMFCHPTPQSRDRIYIVFWRKGNKAPDLDFRPKAPCLKCGRNVEAVQTWKNRRTVGKYGPRNQYIYTCPVCRLAVSPYYFAALNAIDFSIPSQRIGDRDKELKPRTMERIRYGAAKYGRRPLAVRVNMTSGLDCRVRDATTSPMDTIPATAVTALVSPAAILRMTGQMRVHGLEEQLGTQIAVCGQDWLLSPQPLLVETAFSNSEGDRTRSLDAPMTTQSGRQSLGVASPFLTTAGSRDSQAGVADPMPTHTATERMAVVQPFISTQRTHDTGHPLDKPLPPMCTGNHHMLVQPSALISMRFSEAMHVGDLSEEMRTQSTKQQMALISRSPFLTQYYGTLNASPLDAGLPTIATLDTHGLVEPEGEIDIMDWFFRMLQPPEIGIGMAFPETYIVGGTKREMVKQYGNAVTPPAMDDLLGRAIASLGYEQ